jgi:TolB-like protein
VAERPAGAALKPAGAVFLSYASEDSEATARIAVALRAAGIEVWFDREELRGGDAWDEKIRRQIKDCRLFIPIISANSESRLEGYFRREWTLAADRTEDMANEVAFIVPIVIDGTLNTTAHVPPKFHRLQWTRLPDGAVLPAFVSRIAALLGAAASDTGTASTGLAEALVAHSPIGRRRASRYWLGVAVLAIAVGSGWFIWRAAVTHSSGDRAASNAAQLVAPEKSIAVLPFVDMSEKRDQEYLADGIVDELLGVLVRIPELRVIGRTSSFQFRGRGDDPREIGTKLGVAHLVEGTVRRSGDEVRVSVQLIRASDGVLEWSGTYDRALVELLQLQTDIALSLGRALQTSVADVWSHAPGRARNAEANELYLRGVHALNRETVDGFQEAQSALQRALELDPQFTRAREMLALTHQILAANAWVPAKAGWEQVRRDAMDLLQHDPKSATAHVLLARIHTLYTWDWAEAQRELDTAATLGRRDVFFSFAAGELALATGQFPEAERLYKETLATDPLNADAYYGLAAALGALDRLDDAEVAARRCLEITPTFEGGYETLGVIRVYQGRFSEALEFFKKETMPGLRATLLPIATFALGRRAEAKQLLEEAVRAHGEDQPSNIAAAYAYMGDADSAFAWLDRAYQARSPFLLYFKASKRDFKSISSDPRYTAFLRKMNLPD